MERALLEVSVFVCNNETYTFVQHAVHCTELSHAFISYVA